ncbi:golgi uridine diphosphate-N-acetylglucosamine transporter [Savitreella phatthalungensis]
MDIVHLAGSPLSFVFGGCCANVYTLEALTRRLVSVSLALTFAQFAGVTLGSCLILHFTDAGILNTIRHPRTPWYSYARIVAFHFGVSVLNNLVLDYEISVPVHIIIRSGGSVVTMLLAWTLYGKMYSMRQVLSICCLTLGVVLATMSGRAGAGHWPQSVRVEHIVLLDSRRFVTGLALMLLGQICSSMMGLTLDNEVRRHRSPWQESLFWTHALALPCFLPFTRRVLREFSSMKQQQQGELGSLALLLAVNVSTQFVCVVGVNRLAVASNALSVTVVLNIRKFISLALSFGIFGHKLERGQVLGTLLVFGGATAYSLKAGESRILRDSKHLIACKDDPRDVVSQSQSTARHRKRNQEKQR